MQTTLAPANLLIAVNPAIEASMLDRTVLAGGQNFATDGSAPQLLVLDADNDKARSVWFRIGQGLGNLTHVHTAHSQAEQVAVAKLPGQVKFDLTRDGAVPDGGRPCDNIVMKTDTLHLIGLDGRPCTNSVMVVQTHQNIIDGHSGIWGDANREFLIQFVGKERAGFVKTVR